MFNRDCALLNRIEDSKPASTESHFAGSDSCQECHAAIYQQSIGHPVTHSIRTLGDQKRYNNSRKIPPLNLTDINIILATA
jgi:hypothetical protein